ncbi:DUF2059 domain-containing protein [Aquimarina hainanensis]|uniref:DUF2059 domain-containing protein n=1 Tax=Aquimarina hainanensis TaxID=1578017 RepID=A0ABW5N674_9FLAO|nr:DUF2059 domain-containing protein [Aquimarina sp. TRL1]QKX05624.1 DUF2059 domain-containing protein [Aquimarina sp. TRL1]
MKKVIVSLFIFLTYTVFSQQRSYHEDVKEYFDLNGTTQQYSNAVDQMYELLRNQLQHQVPAAIWEELQREKNTTLGNVKSLLTQVYKEHFSHQEIKELLAFYKSETGKQFRKNPDGLSRKQNKRYERFLASDVGQKVKAQSQSLKKAVGEASELWSRDLYRETVKKLKAKGYSFSQ